MHRLLKGVLLLVGLAALISCKVLKTTDSESTHGRGATAFDPYSVNSGAVKLGLQWYKGCAILANGTPIMNGSAKIPYPSPDQCQSFWLLPPPGSPMISPPMELRSGTRYFLGKLTLFDGVEDVHTDFSRPMDAADWIETQSAFKSLDWSGLSIVSDRYVPEPEDDLALAYNREVLYGNANWQLRDSTFTVDALNADGRVVATQTYNKSELLAENPVSYHTRLMWRVANIGAPKFPGDPNEHPGSPDAPPHRYQTVARIDFEDSTNPFKTLDLDSGLSGDGAIRLTWSEMPGHPFYFPVHYIKQSDVPATCYSPDGSKKVPCDFGIDSSVLFTQPKNGKYYAPGETVGIKVAVTDGKGNLLHTPGYLPTWEDYIQNNSNGLQYFNASAAIEFFESQSFSGMKVAGPIQDFRPAYDMNHIPFTQLPQVDEPFFGPNLAELGQLPGWATLPVPARNNITIPNDAKPGTYVALIKLHRQFEGERVNTIKPFFFQVGQEEVTRYPGRVGNCQICHRSVLSLNNLFHGISVDNVEACKACHTGLVGEMDKIVDRVHRIHMMSNKFPADKRNCTYCHLTRESALRPSIAVCNACHPTIHGDKYFELEFAGPNEPNRYTNCAQSCHVLRPPTQHILPPQ